jgi:hypothetical protein
MTDVIETESLFELELILPDPAIAVASKRLDDRFHETCHIS